MEAYKLAGDNKSGDTDEAPVLIVFIGWAIPNVDDN